MSYTKGPWKVETNEEWLDEDEKDQLTVYGISGSNNQNIVSTDSGYYKLSLDDAKLIAAAPDLVEALDSLAAYAKLALNEITDQDTGWYYQLQEAIRKGEKAITKAKGCQV